MNALLDVLKGRMPSRRAIWIMRQAGRYLPEYREVRKTAGSFLSLCYNPELASEVTLQPLRRFDLDAAILFSDILVVPHAMGLALDFRDGEGPVIETVSDAAGVSKLSGGIGSEQFKTVFETVGRVKDQLQSGKALIGFCGAPWTVASYMIEGGSSRRQQAVAVALANPAWFQLLLDRLVVTSVDYLLGQITAGVDVVQIFDSWAGDVPDEIFERVVVAPIKSIISALHVAHPGFPVIVFARGCGAKHSDVAVATGATCVGVEEGIDLMRLVRELPIECSVQGNLANESLMGDFDVMERQVISILQQVPRSRHVFNLGHGILPTTPVQAVERLLAVVRMHG